MATPNLPPAAQAEIAAAEKTISGWRINGWLAIALALAANLVGCVTHV